MIDAVFSLVQENKVPPTVDEVAERAGISVSSVFRNFDGLDDMRRQAFDRFEDRYRHLLDAPVDAAAARPVRIREHVRARLVLCAEAGPIMRLARQRALDHQPMADGVARIRERLADETRRRFAIEVDGLRPADAADLIALVDTLTSPEAFETMGSGHGRTPRQIARAWTTALEVLLDSLCGTSTTAAATAMEEAR